MKLIQTSILATCLLGALPCLAEVAIEFPANGAVVTSPVRVNISNQGQEAYSISLYMNGILITRQRGIDTVDSSVSLDPGTYTVKAVANASNYYSVASSKITVTASGQDHPNSPPSTPGTPTPPAQTSVAAQIAADMQGKNEGNPHGVPLSYDFAVGPSVSMGNNSKGWQAITSWGVLYEAAEGNPATNTRVNIRNMQTYFLQKSSGKWLLLQNTSQPQGAAYLENFAGDVNKPANVRTEADGTISAIAGGGFNFHFYPANRASINPNDIGGIVVVLQARLILADASKADDRGVARYLLGAGADYYPALTGGWPGNADFNPGVAGGKMKYVRSAWRSFAMTTMTQAELSSNPPPVNLSGIAP